MLTSLPASDLENLQRLILAAQGVHNANAQYQVSSKCFKGLKNIHAHSFRLFSKLTFTLFAAMDGRICCMEEHTVCYV
jgi:hypothetical protein